MEREISESAWRGFQHIRAAFESMEQEKALEILTDMDAEINGRLKKETEISDEVTGVWNSLMLMQCKEGLEAVHRLLLDMKNDGTLRVISGDTEDSKPR